jgi:hypothetical protein
VPPIDFILAFVCYELFDLLVIQIFKRFGTSAVPIELEQQLVLVNLWCLLVPSTADSQEICFKPSFILPVINILSPAFSRFIILSRFSAAVGALLLASPSSIVGCINKSDLFSVSVGVPVFMVGFVTVFVVVVVALVP